MLSLHRRKRVDVKLSVVCVDDFSSLCRMTDDVTPDDILQMIVFQ